jgi:hypothetical protein
LIVGIELPFGPSRFVGSEHSAIRNNGQHPSGEIAEGAANKTRGSRARLAIMLLDMCRF